MIINLLNISPRIINLLFYGQNSENTARKANILQTKDFIIDFVTIRITSCKKHIWYAYIKVFLNFLWSKDNSQRRSNIKHISTENLNHQLLIMIIVITIWIYIDKISFVPCFIIKLVQYYRCLQSKYNNGINIHININTCV